jgi:hypothetical protein
MEQLKASLETNHILIKKLSNNKILAPNAPNAGMQQPFDQQQDMGGQPGPNRILLVTWISDTKRPLQCHLQRKTWWTQGQCN